MGSFRYSCLSRRENIYKLQKTQTKNKKKKKKTRKGKNKKRSFIWERLEHTRGRCLKDKTTVSSEREMKIQNSGLCSLTQHPCPMGRFGGRRWWILVPKIGFREKQLIAGGLEGNKAERKWMGKEKE